MLEPCEERAGLEEAPYGFCTDCGTPLQNWGAASDGNGDIYDEIGCPLCEETKEKRHATYCHCLECNPYASLEEDWIDVQIQDSKMATGL